MTDWLSVSPHQGASHLHMIEHLSGPLTAGAGVTPCAIGNDARLVVTWQSREPLLFAAPRANLDKGALRLTAALEGAVIATAYFVRFTEAQTFLHLYRPTVNEANMAAPFQLTLELVQIDPEGVESPVDPAAVANLITVHMVEGIMGRTLYLLGAEKARLRRLAHEIQAGRTLDDAHDHALDMIGAEVSVPRFSDHFALKGDNLINESRYEPDVEYRRRLRLYRSWIQPTPRGVDTWLNGEPAGNNTGLLSELGVEKRFHIVETPNPIAVAITIGGSDPEMYKAFFEYLRYVYLIDVSDAPGTEEYHANRFLSDEQRAQLSELRTRLREYYGVPNDRSIGVAPALAAALDNYGKTLKRLGVPTLEWLRGFDPAGGSRYQLGLGADLAALDAATLDQITLAAEAERAALVITETSSEVDIILKGVEPKPAADDPDGAWLLHACGLRTVHRIDPTRLYVSHFPSFGLVIEPSIQNLDEFTPHQTVNFAAFYEAPGLPKSNIVLEHGLTEALTAWTAIGNSEWTALPDAAGDERLERVQDDHRMIDVFTQADLTLTTQSTAAAAALKDAPPELFKVLLLPEDLSQLLRNGSEEGVGQLHRLIDLLREHGIISVLPLVTDTDEIILGVGVISLVGVGINIVDRRSTGFRWYTVPLHPLPKTNEGGKEKGGMDSVLTVQGSRATFTPRQSGLEAGVVLGYARGGLVDPYEFRIEVADDVILEPIQYEFLMNMLERLYPIGVEVNTYPVRRAHVNFGADTLGKPLSPKVARTYRKFVRRRFAGLESTIQDETER
jgi:hypothetical protein